MKPVVLFVLAGLVVLGAMLTAAYTIDRSSPGVDAARARQAAAGAREAEARANLAEHQAVIDAAEYPRRAGAMTVAVILAALGAGVGLAVAGVGLAIGLTRWLNLRAQLVAPDRHTALYPGVVQGATLVTANERGAQLVAAMPRRPTAALMSRILAPPVEAPAQVAALPAPAPILLPDRVELSAWHPGQGLALPVGVGPNGRAIDIPLRGDLSLITAAGLPGSGKTSLLRSFAHSIATQSPWGDRCKAVIIDPKRVEFSQLDASTPWLWRPVCRDHGATGRALHDLVNELDDRFKLMERARQATYQGLGWPAIVLLVDELSILAKDRAIMGDLTRLATLGRAAGVVVVAATQRPSAHVLTPELRALADVSVSFRVRSANESRLTLADYTGAELLPADKPGRAIYKRDDLVMCQTYLAPAFAMPPPPRFQVVEQDDDQVEQDDDDQVEHLDESQRDDAVWIAQARQMAAAGASRRKIELAIFGYAGGAATRRVEAALQGTQAE
jgi:hypothetical protein